MLISSNLRYDGKETLRITPKQVHRGPLIFMNTQTIYCAPHVCCTKGHGCCLVWLPHYQVNEKWELWSAVQMPCPAISVQAPSFIPPFYRIGLSLVLLCPVTSESRVGLLWCRLPYIPDQLCKVFMWERERTSFSSIHQGIFFLYFLLSACKGKETYFFSKMTRLIYSLFLPILLLRFCKLCVSHKGLVYRNKARRALQIF